VSLQAKLAPGKSGVDPDTKLKTTLVPGSKVTLKEDFSAVRKELQGFNKALNRAHLDYKIQDVNSNAAAGTGYQNTTRRPAPGLSVLPGSKLNLNVMIKSAATSEPPRANKAATHSILIGDTAADKNPSHMPSPIP